MEIEIFAKKSLLLALNSSYEQIIRRLNLDLKKEGCNFLQSLILISIYIEKKKPVTPSHLADTFFTSKSNVSHAISALEKNKYAKRKTNQNDSRKWEISITQNGQEIVHKLIQIIDQYENTFEKSIGKKQTETFISQLKIFSQQALLIT